VRAGWFAWTTGIIVALAAHWLLSIAAESIGLPVWISYGEPIYIDHGSWDEERDGHSTALGWWLIAVSVAVGSRFGLAVSTGTLNGKVSRNGNAQMAIVLGAMTLYAVVMTIVWAVFGRILMALPGIVALLVDGLALAGTFFSAREIGRRRGVEW
jgi:hypothetical protein